MNYNRRDPRFEIDQPVTVTNLHQPQSSVLGRLVNFSANGTRLLLEQEMKPGTMVKVEWGGTLLLGEIVYCTPQNSEFAAGLALEDAVYDTLVLASMVDMEFEQAAAKR